MESEYKPKVYIEIFLSIFIFFIFSISLFLFFLTNISEIIQIIIFFCIAPMAHIIKIFIRKKFSTYLITDEKVVSRYQFINKEEEDFEVKNIVSLLSYKGVFSKIFNLCNFRIGIYGKDFSLNTKNKTYIRSNFLSIKDHFEFYEDLKKILFLEDKKVLYEVKPKLIPEMFYTTFFLSIIILPLIYLSFFVSNYFLFLLVLFSVFYFSLIIFLYLKLSSTKFSITESYVEYSFDFFLWKKNLRVSIKNISNVENKKNIFTYFLFKTQNIKIFNGSDLDIKFFNLENFEKVKSLISNLLENKDITQNLDTQIIQENISSVAKNTIKSENSFLFSCALNKIIFFIICLTSIFLFSSINLSSTIFLVGVFIFLCIWFLLNFVYWKNFKYEFFEDKIILSSGIINQKKVQIKYSNIQNIKLNRNFFFDKILDQGSIFIYTAGTSSHEGFLVSIKDYENFFDLIDNKISNQN